MLKWFLVLIFLASCSSLPTRDELIYRGEGMDKIGPYGLLIGHIVVPVDRFPFDRRSAVIYFENTFSKEEFYFGETKGGFSLKLPPGDYVVKDIWFSSKCNISNEAMVNKLFENFPRSMMTEKDKVLEPVFNQLQFRVVKGKMTDLGNLLMTCFEWDSREKFQQQFLNYLKGGPYGAFLPKDKSSQECGCKILRRKDPISRQSIKKF